MTCRGDREGEEGLPGDDLGLANAQVRLQHTLRGIPQFALGWKAPGDSWLKLEIPLVMRTLQPGNLLAGQPLFEES